MDYSFVTLNSLLYIPLFFNVPRVSLYSFTRGNERLNSCDLKAYELYPSQGTLQKDLDYAHIPMYATIGGYPHMYTVIGVKSAYITFLMFLGMIKDTSKDKKWSIGANESAAG